MTTELALITEGGTDIVAMFKDGGAQIDPILARIEAEVNHRAEIAREIADALNAMSGRATPSAIAEALIEGRIPHCKVSM